MKLLNNTTVLVLALAGGLSSSAHAAQIFALTTTNSLVSFDSATPGTTTPVLAITGLQPLERLLGIDFRPATGQLYSVGTTSQVYLLNTTTGAATAVGGPFSPVVTGTNFGLDFNPTVDRIRLVSDAGQNLRLNPTTGVAITDTALAFAAGDLNFGNSPFVVGAAYTNNVNGALSTTLYDIDSRAGILAIQNLPNAGTLNTVGSLGVATTGLVGFDISGADGTAFASLTSVAGTPRLYTINLATGAATNIGVIGGGTLGISDISVVPIPEPSSLVLGGLGLAGLLAWRRKRAA